MDCVRGPTLLDLRDLYGSTLKMVSYIILTFSIGSMIGSFLTGAILDKILKHRYLFMFISTCYN